MRAWIKEQSLTVQTENGIMVIRMGGPKMKNETIRYKPIGIIHSPFKGPRDAPIQSAFAKGIEGSVDVFPEYGEGLVDLEGFSHIILLYHFHLSKGFSLQVKPYLDEQLRGVFATRAPARPNPIGMSIVRLVKVEGRKLSIQDVDILDGTPLLDIKPYVPDFDCRKIDKMGWLSGKIDEFPEARDDGRFCDIKSIFDIFTDKYDAWYDSEEGIPLYESELKCLMPMVESAPPPILEIGVGTGRFAMHFPDVTGIDPSLKSLRMAKKRGVKTVHGYGENLPFGDETFGCILIIVTLCFVEKPLEVLREAKRVLRKDGSIIIGLVPRDSPWGKFYNEKKKAGHPFYSTARFYTLKDVEDMLQVAGLKISEIRSTLLQRPDEPRRVEEPQEGYIRGAGFLCIKARPGN
jgi:tRNA (adenine37-N6)-methyltransferase